MSNFFVRSGIKVTFLYYPFKAHFKPLLTEVGLKIFPIQEIAIQKAYTIGRRGEYRDYFDLYSILKGKYIKLGELIKLAKQSYGGAFDEKIFLEQLVYFGDITNFEIIPVAKGRIPKSEEVKEFFEVMAKEYLSSKL